MRHGFLALAYYRHALALATVPTNRRINAAGQRLRQTPDQSPVAPRNLVLRKLCGKRRQCRLGLRHHQQPRGILIQAVHDAGPLYPADTGKGRAAVVQQAVDQSPAAVPGRRMHHQSRWFIDHQQSVILVNNIERDGFGFKPSRLCGR